MDSKTSVALISKDDIHFVYTLIRNNFYILHSNCHAIAQKEKADPLEPSKNMLSEKNI